MLLFYCAPEADLPALRRAGLHPPGGASLWTSFAAVRAGCAEHVLVVDPQVLDGPLPEAPGDRVHVPGVPAQAFRNLDPYLPPVPIDAAGGYVVRFEVPEPEVLLIFRRGVWDLPKGKRDDGEDLEACALREVREEVGVQALRLVGSVGTTVHGYARQGRYEVKTTYWFLMETPETRFTPQAEEDIEAVAWVPWSDALRRVGYDTLRRHMLQITPEVVKKR